MTWLWIAFFAGALCGAFLQGKKSWLLALALPWPVALLHWLMHLEVLPLHCFPFVLLHRPGPWVLLLALAFCGVLASAGLLGMGMGRWLSRRMDG